MFNLKDFVGYLLIINICINILGNILILGIVLLFDVFNEVKNSWDYFHFWKNLNKHEKNQNRLLENNHNNDNDSL